MTENSSDTHAAIQVEDYDSLIDVGTAIGRRAVITGTAAIAAMGASSTPAGAAIKKVDGASLTGPYLDLTTPEGNMIALARMDGDITMKEPSYGWYDGLVMGVMPGGPVKNICGFKGMSCKRLIPYEEGNGFRRLLREVGYYYDLATGKILEELNNPYTGETVKVVHIANDPFNMIIRDIVAPGPSYGGLNTAKRKPKPLLLDWRIKDDYLLLQRHIHLYYKNALDPTVWVRESAGPMNRASEFYFTIQSLDDMQNEELSHIRGTGTWARITPWLPWMLMGQAPGHCAYQCFMGAPKDLDDIPKDIVEYTAKHYSKFLEPPSIWEEPSLSSLEWYAREQNPAPPGGT